MEGKLYMEPCKQAGVFVLLHVPEALSSPCLRDFRDHNSDMPYDIVNKPNKYTKTMTYTTSEEDVTRPGAVQERLETSASL